MTPAPKRAHTGLHHSIGHWPQDAQVFLLQKMLVQHRQIVWIAAHDREMADRAAQLVFALPDVQCLTFPAWDCQPFDRASPKPQLIAQRMHTLASLCAPSAAPQIVLTTVNALLQRVPPKSWTENAVFTVKPGQKLALESLRDHLISQGFRRNDKVMEAGEFAVRGGLVDVATAHHESGLRLDFMGNTLEAIRTFDLATQRTTGSLPQLTLTAAQEYLLTPQTARHFADYMHQTFGPPARKDPLTESISALRPYPGMEHFLPLFHDTLDTLWGYLDQPMILTQAPCLELLEQRHAAVLELYQHRVQDLADTHHKRSEYAAPPYLPLPPEMLYAPPAEWNDFFDSHPAIITSAFDAPDAAPAPIDIKRSNALYGLHADAAKTPFQAVESLLPQNGLFLIACKSEESAQRWLHRLQDAKIPAQMMLNLDEICTLKPHTLGIAHLPLEMSLTWQQHAQSVTFLAEQELPGAPKLEVRKPRRTIDVFFQESAPFLPGEYVVHREHGIARFERLVSIEVAGLAHDCLKLIYADDDRLFLPVVNMDVLSKYSASDEGGVALDKLGSAGWQTRKAKAKERIRMAAETLLHTAAMRALQHADAIAVDVPAYEQFCSRFGFVETEDQASAIDDVLRDLASPKPMDRLICGDVGFGKTEVALRAAFAATHHAEGKMQVAVVTPTTLLARQHANLFQKRFEGTGINVRTLSRMVNAASQKETKEMLKNGQCDIVIGTHGLLHSSIKFSHLGLVIIDEEQHFGVQQKEALKALQHNVHVLTLSATPIPRTLQFALTGVRELSIIATPPVNRLAVRTFVMMQDPPQLREALMREAARGGQSFYVAPKIADLAGLQQMLHDIAPQLRVAVAHGQMTPTALDTIMNEFYDRKYDVLLSTAIIESGLDIPNANTLIVHRSDQFGLAQLYQLRGRVGRGSARAYAYFTTPSHGLLTPQAVRRLEVLQSLDTLGAGFMLASHDMDMRGFGNLVGEEQSGHVREVGIELYQQMLEETVAQLRNAQNGNDTAAPISREWSPQIQIDTPALIPPAYVADVPLRLSLYRRLAKCETAEELDSMRAEFVDRFGPTPPEFLGLLYVLRLKQLCKQAAIARIDVGPRGAIIAFEDKAVRNPLKLLEILQKNPFVFKLRPDQKTLVHLPAGDDAARKTALEHAISLLATPQTTSPFDTFRHPRESGDPA